MKYLKACERMSDVAQTQKIYDCPLLAARGVGLAAYSTRERINMNMNNATYRVLGVCAFAIVFAALAFGGVSAQEKKKAEPKPAACNSLKEESACEGRNDCNWVAASIDEKTKKEKRKAYCRAKPKSSTKKA
jgi:hypothetical protein